MSNVTNTTSTSAHNWYSDAEIVEEEQEQKPQIHEYMWNWPGAMVSVALIITAGITGWWLLILLCFLTGGIQMCRYHGKQCHE